MRKAGRYTAALLLIAVGAAVIADHYAQPRWTALVIEWWPVLFIALGLEYILLNMKYGDSDKQLKLDMGGVTFAVLISSVVLFSPQPAASLGSWFDQVGGSFGSMIGEGRRVEKPASTVSLPAGVDRIAVVNDSGGSVTVVSESVDQLHIESAVYVTGDGKEAGDMAEQSRVETSVVGNTLQLTVRGAELGERFWIKRQARMDIVLNIPASAQLNMDFELTNGQFEARQLTLKKEMKVRTTNGAILVSSIVGDMDFHSTNAAIKSSGTRGNLRLETTNGTVEAAEHQGDAHIDSTNGAIRVAGITGAIAAETSNGGIYVTEASQSLKAHTTNGPIEVTSRSVNGSWDLKTSHGAVQLKLPSNGDYRIEGEGQKGEIRTNLPLQIRGDSVDGTIGTGKHPIKIQTKGGISVQTLNGL